MERSGGDQNPPESPWEWNKQTANVMERWLLFCCVCSLMSWSVIKWILPLASGTKTNVNQVIGISETHFRSKLFINLRTNKTFQLITWQAKSRCHSHRLNKRQEYGGKNGWNSQGIKWDAHKCMRRQKHAFLCMHTGTGPSSALTYAVCACTCRDLVSWARTSTRDWQCLVASLAETEGLAWREWMNPLE